ncbi:hypothetical protein CPB86DRAFT_780838 [Serendipita vermifera]|nr:hypothetical protein CPB86DRAFT_780838 [Serendipita vermifera]
MQSSRVYNEPHVPQPGPPPFPFSEFDDSSLSYNPPPFPLDLQQNSGSLGVENLFYPPQPSGSESMSFFSRNEQDDMLDFLRDFDTTEPWEFNPILPSRMPSYPETITEESFHPPHADNDQSGIADTSSVASVHSSTGTVRPNSETPPQMRHSSPPPLIPHHPSMLGQSQLSASPTKTSSSLQADFRPKPLLSAPQKRMNHVKSEKRRRDTIRDGYLTLTKLLSPSDPGAEQLAIPRRGRPKGSGRTTTGKKTGKGKSGVLFRAVEYIHFMEEHCEALERECERLEKLALGAPGSSAYLPVSYGHSW